jgi:Ca2+-binding RTX toxin-like protein
MYICTMARMYLFSGRLWLAGVVGVLALLATPTVAAPASQIVVYGAASGSTLTLSTRGGDVVVHGNMARRAPEGCRIDRHHMNAVCPTGGQSSLEVRMGDGGDLVRVAERMPFPLIAHLGAGSDKFIGNAERDVCFSEGSRRNRCIGGPNNDVCITGPRNSDCVGGPGDDFCRHETGSDGCWGGPGDDVCIMGPGEDGCHGEAGDDRLYGGASPDQLYGGLGHDYCNGGPGWGKSHSCDAGPRR